MLNECYVCAHFVFNLFLPSKIVKIRLLIELYYVSLYSKKSHFVFTPLEETVFVLTKRLKLLDKVLVSVISGNASLNGDVRNDLLSYVSDKDKFIHDTYHQYKRLHPRFVAFLRSKGLSEWETGYCCLYALGLRGKDVGAFLERGGHYNIDSRIRRKLGLGTEDANLGNHVRSRLKELSD